MKLLVLLMATALAAPADFSFALRPGAALEPDAWSHQHELVVPSTSSGLYRLAISAEDAGLLRADRGDLRIVDSKDRQWAWVAEAEPRPRALEATLLEPETEDGETTWRLELPVGPVPLASLDLDFDQPFFDRSYELLGGADGPSLARGRLARRERQTEAVSVELGGARVQQASLVVHDGDDAPLVLQRAVAQVQSWAVLSVLKPGRYRILVGNPEAEQPEYELARAGSQLLGGEATPLTPKPLIANPQHDPQLRAVKQRGPTVLLWALLGIIGAGLAVVTLRASGASGEPEP